MQADAAAVGAAAASAGAPAGTTPTSTPDYPHDLPKREIEISEAAQRLANALQLHLD